MNVVFEKGVLSVVAVDVTVHKKLAQDQAIVGVPTMRLYQGKKVIADYKGPRTQSDLSAWLQSRLQPLKLDYNSAAFERYVESSYTMPRRFLYLYPAGDAIDTTTLVKSAQLRGSYAEVAVPESQVHSLLTTRKLRKLPILVTVSSQGWEEVEISSGEVKESPSSPKMAGKRFGDGSSGSMDSHGSFTFLFFLIGIIGIGVFAWKQLRVAKRQHDALKSV